MMPPDSTRMKITSRRKDDETGEHSQFMADALAGLTSAPKRLRPKYFYDRIGSRLFDDICDLPEYYITRAELSIVEAHAKDMVGGWGKAVRLVEPGAGSGTKTRLLLRALGVDRTREYVPVDIARDHLADSAARLAHDLPWLSISPLCADFDQEFHLGPSTAERTVVYFPGSTIGNFDPPDAARLLARFRRIAGPSGAILLGVDLKKDPRTLHAAYNDRDGVTAAFNKNLLVRMNRELGATFDVDAFTHYAFYEPMRGRIEMHLISSRKQRVLIGDVMVSFEEGESVRTECSYKYAPLQIARLAHDAGLSLVNGWFDAGRRFAVVELRPAAHPS